jgi:hypothetical protein
MLFAPDDRHGVASNFRLPSRMVSAKQEGAPVFGWEWIKKNLTATSNLTTAEIAKAAGKSEGHIRRVLVHLRDVEGWAASHGSPARWSRR